MRQIKDIPLFAGVKDPFTNNTTENAQRNLTQMTLTGKMTGINLHLNKKLKK